MQQAAASGKEKVLQGSVSPTALDASDFLLTCNKLRSRFKSFWDNSDSAVSLASKNEHLGKVMLDGQKHRA